MDLPRSRQFAYEVLARAAQDVQQCVAADESNDSEPQFVTRNKDILYVKGDDSAAEMTEGVEYEEFIPIPRQFLSLQAETNSASYMGLLPELHHAWISIDSRLYLWDYTSENREKFHVLCGFASHDVILDVVLVNPKADIFTTSVRYVLVVVSLLEINLFSVILSSDSTNSVSFQRSPYRTSTQGLSCKVASSQRHGKTADRIFLSSSEGGLYELQYFSLSLGSQIFSVDAVRKGWAALTSLIEGPQAAAESEAVQYNCELRRIGRWDTSLQTGIISMLPSFLEPPPGMKITNAQKAQQTKDGTPSQDSRGYKRRSELRLVDVIVDHIMGLLFACSSNGFVKIFKLEANGLTSCCGSFDLFPAALAVSSSGADVPPQAQASANTLSVVKFLLNSTRHSVGTQLTAILSTGTRMHLQAVHTDGSPYDNAAAGNDKKNITLKITHMLELPAKLGQLAMNFSSAQCAFYNRGVCLVEMHTLSADARDGQASVLCTADDSRLRLQTTTSAFREVATIPIGGEGGDITHLLHGDLCDIQEAIAMDACTSEQHELARQYSSFQYGTEFRRRFLCLESRGIHVLVKRQPLFRVKALLQQFSQTKSRTGESKKEQSMKKSNLRSLHEIMQNYGSVEFCTMFVSAIIGKCSLDNKPDDLSLLLSHFPECTHSTFLRTIDNQCTYVPSALVRGVQCLLARMLGHLWERPILRAADSQPNLDVEALRLVLDPLHKLEELLLASFQFEINEPLLSDAELLGLLQGQASAAGDKFAKASLDNSSVGTVYRLVTRARQALDLIAQILTADKHSTEKLEALFPWHLLGSHSLRSVVVAESGATALSVLARLGLKNFVIKDLSDRIDPMEIAQSFLRAAPSYFHLGDVKEFGVYIQLTSALHASSDHAFLNHLQGVKEDLLCAAGFWRDIADVSSQHLQGSHLEVNASSTCYASPLGLYTRLLALIATDASLEILVDLCLSTAKNFGSNGHLRIESLDSGAQLARQYCYHSGSKLCATRQRLGQQLCYNHMLSIISNSDSSGDMNTRGKITERQRQCMLSKGLHDCADDLFKFMTCDALRGRHTYSLLMHLPIPPFVERYLYCVDKWLLYEWYYIRATAAAKLATENSSSHVEVRQLTSPTHTDSSANAVKTPMRVIAENGSLALAEYICEQYEKSSMLMFLMAGGDPRFVDYAVPGIDSSDMPSGSRTGCVAPSATEYLPIALRYQYLRNAVHSAQAAFHQICVNSPGAKVSHTQDSRRCRLRRWLTYLIRLRKLAEIQMDAYKTSMAANVYVAEPRTSGLHSGWTRHAAHRTKAARTSAPVGDATHVHLAGVIPFSCSSTSNPQLPVAVDSLKSNVNFALGFTLISEDDWVDRYFDVVRDLCLWDINLRLLHVFGATFSEEVSTSLWKQRSLNVSESVVIRLWKSYIYREVPDHSLHAAGSTAGAFLLKQRDENEIYIDTLHNVARNTNGIAASNTLSQYRDAPFEQYDVWLPLLKTKMESLCKQLEVGDSHDGGIAHALHGADPRLHSCKRCTSAFGGTVAAPLAPLIVELEALATELHQIQQAGSPAKASSRILHSWVSDLLLSVHVRRISVVRAYVTLFQTRAKGFGPEKNVKLLESLTHVLLTWVHDAARLVRGGFINNDKASDSNVISAEDVRDLKETVCSRELSSWLDLLRHQLSDITGRHNLSPHCTSSIRNINSSFMSLMAQVDALHFR